MQRQVWIFLNDADEEALIQRLDAGRGLRRIVGRYVRGESETAQLTKSERWTHLVHPEISKEIVLHPIAEGPYAGWSRLDEIRSEVLTIIRPMPDAAGMAPARLCANTHAWFGGDKVQRSRPRSPNRAADAMRIAEEYPPTAFDWIRVAPGAAAWGDSRAACCITCFGRWRCGRTRRSRRFIGRTRRSRK